MERFDMTGTPIATPHAVPSLGWPGGHAWAQPSEMPAPVLGTLAELSSRLPRRPGDPIEILLAAARPFDDGFEPLRPLWVQEAMHRATGMLRLFTALHHRGRNGLSPTNTYEHRLARHLAAELASLESVEASRIPCSGPLREIARDLVGLFGPAVGQVVLDTDVVPLSLPAYRRRALVLLGSELVTNALTHAFHRRSVGRVSLHLQRFGMGRARLQVGDDGVGYVRGRPNQARSIAGALTDLLEGEIGYCESLGRGSMAEVVFPITS